MTTLTDSTIKDFASAVRAELGDLPKSVVEELTGELEAGLEDRRIDEGADFNPGSPVTYAAELREAAGLAPKSKKGGIFSAKEFVAGTEAWFRKSAFTEAIIEFGISIRPLWWVSRAVVAWGLFSGFQLNTLTNVLLLALLVFLSVQWGRKKWFTNKFFATLLLPLNLVAVVLTLPGGLMLANTLNNYYNVEQMMQQWPATEGLRLNGEEVTELKAFDSTNTEVTGLTFKDQRGTEITFPLTDQNSYTVPDIMGLSLYDAQRLLDDANVPAADYVYLHNVSEQEAYVVQVDPPANSTVTSRDVVTITLDRK